MWFIILPALICIHILPQGCLLPFSIIHPYNEHLHKWMANQSLQTQKLIHNNKSWNKSNVANVTLKVVGLISWNTNASPSTNSWSIENPLHPPLSPFFCHKYTVGYSCPSSSINVTVSSRLGRCFLHQCLWRPWAHQF